MKKFSRYAAYCVIFGATSTTSSADVTRDVLTDAADACVTNGVSDDAITARLEDLEWSPIDGDVLADWQLALLASRYLGNAAYKTKYSPSWPQAWAEGLAKTARAFSQSKKENRFRAIYFWEMPSDSAVLLLEKKSLPNRTHISCTVSIQNDPIAERPGSNDPDRRHLRPINSLSLFGVRRRNLLNAVVTLEGIDLNQDVISSLLDGAQPADAFVQTSVFLKVEASE